MSTVEKICGKPSLKFTIKDWANKRRCKWW